MSANKDTSQASGYTTIANDFVAKESDAKSIGDTCQDMAATHSISQASSYTAITRIWAITSSRDNQDDCQTATSHNISQAFSNTTIARDCATSTNRDNQDDCQARKDASSHATATKDSLTARQASLYCHHPDRASWSHSQGYE
jgi:hypothetical protein